MRDAALQQVGLTTMLSLVVGSVIGAGIFVLPASLAPLGWNAPVGWLVSSSGALCIAFALASLTRGGEGLQAHIGQAFGPTAAFVAAWAYWCSCWASISIMALATGTALSRIAPQFADGNVATGAAIAFVIILTAVNALGIRSAGRMQTVTTLIKVVPLVAVVLAFALRSGSGRQVPALAPTPVTFEGVATAAALTIFALTGFENATTPVGKVRDSRRTIPLAMMIGLFLVAVLYLLSSTSVLFLLSPAAASASPAPFADALGGEWGEAAVVGSAACIAVSAFGCLNGNILAAGELAYAMALRADLPSVLARTRADGTPVPAQCFASALGVGLILLAANQDAASIFTFIILVTTVGNLVMYMLATIAAFLAVRSMFVRLVIPVAGAFIVFAFYGAGFEANAWGWLLVVSGLAARSATRHVRARRTLAPAA
jgi:basic amino acid/polyamine antiporter, APA family